MRTLNGNYINYAGNEVSYKTQSNYYGTPPFTYDNDLICTSTNNPILMQTDDNMHIGGSFYKTGPIPCENCPFYNYLLPYNFPYVETDVTPNPKYYWYFPYYKDPTFYTDPYSTSVPKSFS